MANIWGDPRTRIAGAFGAAEGMDEPTRALIHARNLRDQELSAEPSLWDDFASIPSRAWGGAQKMVELAPLAVNALYEDPLGSIDRAGRAGQAATDALVRGAVKPFVDPDPDPVKQAFDLASMLGGPAGKLTLTARGKPVVSTVLRELPGSMTDYASQLETRGPVEAVPGRISTKLSTEERKNPTHTLSIGAMDVVNSHTQKAGYSNMDLVRAYPGMRHMRDAPPELDANVAGEFMNLGAENLHWLYGKLPDWKHRAKNWYVGAHRMAEEWAKKHGIPTESVAGALAALSPKADWFRNASYAERVLDMSIGKNAKRPWSTEMADVYEGTPTLHGYSALVEGKKGDKTTRNVYAAIKGKKLNQLTDDTERALWMTLFDRAHNSKNYRLATPEGDLGPLSTNKGGELSEVGAASIDNIAKADKAIRSGGNLNILSPLMGGAHKVRNFFNNISVPWDRVFRDATIDTHQVAAMHLLPLGQNSDMVAHVLGTNAPPGMRNPVNSVETGVKGSYGLGLDALRIPADDVGLLPREMQSSAWEGVKALFSPEAKRDRQFVPKIYSIWDEVDAGRLSREDARELIFGEATRDSGGQLRLPRWAVDDFQTYDPRRFTTYETNLR